MTLSLRRAEKNVTGEKWRIIHNNSSRSIINEPDFYAPSSTNQIYRCCIAMPTNLCHVTPYGRMTYMHKWTELFALDITVTPQWEQWRLKSPKCRLFAHRLFRRRSKKMSKLRVTGLYEGNPSVIGGFPSQRTSNAENVSIWWRHHEGECPCVGC